MKKMIERNKKLYEKYGKWVLLHNAWTGELPDEEERMFEFSVYDELPSGWAKAFGMEMIDELGKEIDKVGVRDKYYATQIKEKFGCYAEGTEVLTKDGWKDFSEVDYDDEFATLNKDGETLIYQNPTDIMEFDYDGDLYVLQNRGIDLAITPNHKLYVSSGLKGKNFRLDRADNWIDKNKTFKKGCKWNGVSSKTFTIEGYTKTWNTGIGWRCYTHEDIEVDMLDWVRFLGYYIADGSVDKYDIRLAYNPKWGPKTAELVASLGEKIGLTPNVDENSHYVRFTKVKGNMCRWLEDNCYTEKEHKAWTKKVPSFIFELSSEYIEAFLEYLYLADGHKAKTAYTLYTTSEQLRDDVDVLLLKAGYTFRNRVEGKVGKKTLINGRVVESKHVCYAINWLTNSNLCAVDMNKARKTASFVEDMVYYKGKVRCVSIPNHILYVRRNGKGVWCGNSLRWYDNGTTEEMDHIISKYSHLSSHICICCGRPDVGTTSGWITPMCEDCYGKTYHMKNKSPEEVHKAYIGEVGPYNYIEKDKGKDYYNFFNRMPNDYIVRQYGLDCSYEKVYDIHETADMIRRKWNDEHPDDTTPLSDNYIIPPLPKKKKKEKIKFDFL